MPYLDLETSYRNNVIKKKQHNCFSSRQRAYWVYSASNYGLKPIDTRWQLMSILQMNWFSPCQYYWWIVSVLALCSLTRGFGSCQRRQVPKYIFSNISGNHLLGRFRLRSSWWAMPSSGNLLHQAHMGDWKCNDIYVSMPLTFNPFFEHVCFHQRLLYSELGVLVLCPELCKHVILIQVVPLRPILGARTLRS